MKRLIPNLNYGFILVIILLITFWLLVGSCVFSCKSESLLSARLVVQKTWADSLADRTICIYGEVWNEGELTAYNGRLHTIVNGGEIEYILFMGDFQPGELKHFTQPLDGYCNPDTVKCHFETHWSNDPVTLSMDSERVSNGD